MPLFGNPAIRLILTRGFASQPHDWFAFIGEGSKIKIYGDREKASLVPGPHGSFKGISCPSWTILSFIVTVEGSNLDIRLASCLGQVCQSEISRSNGVSCLGAMKTSISCKHAKHVKFGEIERYFSLRSWRHFDFAAQSRLSAATLLKLLC